MYVNTRSNTPFPQPEPVPALIDNPFAPDLFTTGMSGAINMNGVIVVTLECARFDHSKQPPVLERAVVGRLALTAAAAQAMVTNLNMFLESQGLSPTRAFMNGATQQ